MHQSIGDPIGQVERFTSWKADELIYLDISRDSTYDYRDTMQVIGSTSSKRDLEVSTAKDFVEIIALISKKCRIPLTVGGKIRTLEDVHVRLKNGADKVSINTQAFADPTFIAEVARVFGSQCLVASVDVKRDPSGERWEVYTDFGRKSTGKDPLSWCKEVVARGAGEILLQSIDRDGGGRGYDLSLLRMISDAVTVPVVALGGVGEFKHLVEGIQEGHASAVAAANIFHFTEHSVLHAKECMRNEGVDVRL